MTTSFTEHEALILCAQTIGWILFVIALVLIGRLLTVHYWNDDSNNKE